MEPQSETVWRQADRYGVPRIAFVNKMDRVGADFGEVVRQIRERLGARPLPVQIPLGEGGQFEGVIDLVARRARIWDEESLGARFEDVPIPESARDEAEAARESLLESLADLDEAFLERYLAGKAPSDEEVREALRRVTLGLKGVPVLCGAAFRNKGVQLLLDAVVQYLPSPADLPAYEGFDEQGRRGVLRRASDDEPFSALAFKVMTDPYVGQFDVPPGLLGHLPVGGGTVQRRRAGRRSGSAGSWRCTRTSAGRSTRSAPVTSSPRWA